MESAFTSRDVVEAMLSYLDHKSLLQGAALVCLGWREAVDGSVAEEAFQWAFWRYYRSQDETYPFDFAAMSPFPFSWRAECKARHLSRWCLMGDGEQPLAELTTVCDITGDVVFAVAPTPMNSLIICGGESGTLYFIDPCLRGPPAIQYEFEAHRATILALYARPPRGDGASYHVVSGDALGHVQVNLVDVELRCRHPLQAFRLDSAILQFARLSLSVMGSALRDGTVVCWKEISSCKENDQHNDEDEEERNVVIDVHTGEVTHLAALDQLGKVEMVVTASNADQHLRTWRVLHKAGGGEGAIIKLDPLHELALQELGIRALCTSTGMGVSPSGEIAIGFGNGRVCVLDVHTCRVINVISVHGDEVWDVRCAGGGLMVSSSRDRKVAAFRIQVPFSNIEAPDVFLHDVGNWVVRVKCTISRLFMLGFDAQLRVLDMQHD